MKAMYFLVCALLFDTWILHLENCVEQRRHYSQDYTSLDFQENVDISY